MVCLCGNPNNVKDELEKVDEIKFLEGIGSSDHSSEIIDSISVKKISKASSEDHHEKDKKHLNHEQKPKLFRYASSPVKGIGGWQFNMGCRNLNPDSVANPQAFRKVKVQGSSTKDFVIQERNEVNKLKKLQKKPHSHSRSHSRSSVKAKDVKHLSAISEDPFNFP
ncbi:hypothetical protein DFH28DRAFT_922519 [Melampsora americana]|nr:hypothetical protein DFH28DRAFT_922519 [Melampsora americana]